MIFIFVFLLLIFIIPGIIIHISESERLKEGDLLNSENDRELFIERYSQKQIELKRIRTIGRYKGGHSTIKNISIDAPTLVNSGWVTITEYLQIIEIGRFKDRVLFYTGYTEKDKDILKELVSKIT